MTNKTKATPSVETEILTAIRHTQAAHRAATEAQDADLAAFLVMAHKALEKAMVRAQRARLGMTDDAAPPVQQTPPPPPDTLPR